MSDADLFAYIKELEDKIERLERLQESADDIYQREIEKLMVENRKLMVENRKLKKENTTQMN
jgi:regulator of replication initiation timing